MKIILKISILFLPLLLFFSCKKEPVTPPIKNLASGTVYTVEQLKSLATCTNNCRRKFADNEYLIGTVLADELSGNFYKEIYLRDRTGNGAIHLDFIYSKSTYWVGDSIRVNLKDLDVWINSSTGMLEIDSIDFEKSCVKFGTGPKPLPKQITLSQLSVSNPYSNYLCDLVTINGVGFLAADTAKTWADVFGQSALNRTLADCLGNQLVVRTDNNAKFAGEKTPKGYGSITGIATAYGATNQLVIRNTAEVNMNGSGCQVYLTKNFNDNSLTSGGWSTAIVTNTAVNWMAASFSGTLFAKVSGYVGGGNTNSQCWLISPPLNLSSANNPVLSFLTAAKFSGNALEVWVSTNYVSGAPGTASWTQLNGFTLSPNNPGSYAWTASGDVSLNAFKTNGVRIAFKYTSTTSAATTYELDDINVREI